MVSITIEQMSENLQTYLQRVAAGESFVVFSQGKPIAQLKPTNPLKLSETLAQLRQICAEENYSLDTPARLDRSNLMMND